MVNKCRDCGHWGDEPPSYCEGKIGNLRKCKKIHPCRGDRAKLDYDSATFCGSCGEYGDDCMYTGPEFGCVHFEQKSTYEGGIP